MPSLQVSKAKVRVEEQPWKRLQINGNAHDHGEIQQVNNVHHGLTLLGRLLQIADIKPTRLMICTWQLTGLCWVQALQ